MKKVVLRVFGFYHFCSRLRGRHLMNEATVGSAGFGHHQVRYRIALCSSNTKADQPKRCVHLGPNLDPEWITSSSILFLFCPLLLLSSSLWWLWFSLFSCSSPTLRLWSIEPEEQAKKMTTLLRPFMEMALSFPLHHSVTMALSRAPFDCLKPGSTCW